MKDYFLLYLGCYREVAEWSKAHAWKVCIPIASGSRVRIPSSLQKYSNRLYFFLSLTALTKIKNQLY